jgi:hypothetical protein
MKYLLPFAIIIFASGCAYLPFFGPVQPIGGGLFLSMRADPQTVFAGSDVRIDIDVDNQNPRNISQVFINVFDSGILELIGVSSGTRITSPSEGVSGCNKGPDDMRPGGFKSLTCFLHAPENLQQDSLTTTVSASTRYTTDLSFVQIIDIMNEDEYRTKQQAGQLVTRPSAYSYQDKNVQIDVEFSESLPIVVRKLAGSKEYYMYITVRNIGNGFISDIRSNQLKIRPADTIQPYVDNVVQAFSEEVVDCPALNSLGWRLQPIGNKFPRITCKIELPLGVRIIENYGLLINLIYTYEVRDSVDVKIIR